MPESFRKIRTRKFVHNDKEVTIEDFSVYEKYVNNYVKRFYTPFLKENIYKVISFKNYNYKNDVRLNSSIYANKTFYVLAEDTESEERVLWDIEDCVFITDEEPICDYVRVANVRHNDYRGYNPFDKNKTYVIDLKRYMNEDSRVLTGAEFGDELRIKTNIDEVDGYIAILLPEDIGSVNPSFIEAFIKPLFIKLGKTEFNEKISFVSTGKYKINDDLYEAIDRILREQKYE